MIYKLYRKLLALYPRTFQEQLGESMRQTFQDLWNEKRQTKKGLFGFVLWTFTETAIGIFREHLLLITEGDIMQTLLRTLGSSTVISFMLILPLMIMEVVNRRNFNEDFPIQLFFAMWLNLFVISLILLPIVRGRRIGNHDMAYPSLGVENTLLTKPRSAALMSVVLILSLVTVFLLNSLGRVNGPDPEQLYVFGIQVPGQFIAIVLLSVPVVAGIIAARPIVRTLRAGGSLFAHPVNLIIVAFILSTFAIGFANLLIDQWPCFMGVPNCD